MRRTGLKNTETNKHASRSTSKSDVDRLYLPQKIRGCGPLQI